MATYKKYLDPEVLTKIARLELRAQMVVEGFVSGMHKSPYHGFSVEFASHREYVPGDDTRHIDWRLFGRGDRLYIKQYEEETNLRAHVLLDCSRSMLYPEHVRGGWRNKYDYASTLAASLIYLLMLQQDATGLLLFDDQVRQVVPPTSRTAQLRAMIEVIEANPPAHATDVKMLFAGLADHVRGRGLVILISDLLTDVDELIAGLQRLRYGRHDVIVLHVHGPRRVGVPLPGEYHVPGPRSAGRRGPGRPAGVAGQLPRDRAAVHQPGALILHGPSDRLPIAVHARAAGRRLVGVPRGPHAPVE